MAESLPFLTFHYMEDCHEQLLMSSKFLRKDAMFIIPPSTKGLAKGSPAPQQGGKTSFLNVDNSLGQIIVGGHRYGKAHIIYHLYLKISCNLKCLTLGLC